MKIDGRPSSLLQGGEHVNVVEVLRKASPNSATHIILEGEPNLAVAYGDADALDLLTRGEHVDGVEVLLKASANRLGPRNQIPFGRRL